MKRRTESLKATAYHEAGHIVARWAQDGSLPREAVVTRTGGIVKGREFSDQEDLIQHARSEVVGYMAGPVAEELATGRDRRQNRGPFGDYPQATNLIRLAGLRISISTAKREAARVLKSNWRLVERVAEALLVQGRLSGAEVLAVIQEATRKELDLLHQKHGGGKRKPKK